MLRYNMRLFLASLVTIIFFVVLKNGHVFDLGLIFRQALVPNRAPQSLLAPPDDLSAQYQKLLVENSALQVLAAENKELKSLLNFQEQGQHRLIIGRVLGRDSVNPGIVMIALGERQGLRVGQAVVVSGGIIIGRVINVNADSSQVRLLTDKFSKIAVQIGANQSLAGLLSGSLGLSMRLTYVPQESELKKGDVVVTAAAQNLIPAGLIVGQVESIDFAQEELFKQAAVSPLIDYDSISIVAVVSL